MIDRLWVKLLGAFSLIIVVGVAVTVVLARQGAATQIDHFMLGGQMVSPETLKQELASYYRQKGSWQGLDAALQRLAMGNGGMMGHMAGVSSRVQVADSEGRIVADTAGSAVGSQLSPFELAQGLSIELDGRPVGTLLITGTGVVASGDQGAMLLAGVTRAVLVAGLVAGAVALLLALLLVRQITRPLAALNEASQRIAAGDLSARVSTSSRDELGQLADTFNQMAGSLEIQESLRRNLMADVAHELRTPLAGIQGTVEALQDGVFALTTENLSPIHEQTLLLARLVGDLRTLANAEAGQLSLERAPLDLAGIAQQQIAAFQPQALDRAIDLGLTMEGNLPSVEGDAQRLGQVLGNLIANALRHTPVEGKVCVCLRRSGNNVQVSISDSGEGILPADLPHIFDRFYRADRSRSRETGGSGLGLAIARQLVELHGGRIWAENHSNGGAVFSFTLPVATE